MNCKICGAELKRPGELCNNCMNKLLKEQERKNDKTEYFTFRRKFVLGYEILRNIESIAIVIFLIILILSVDLSWWKYALGTGIVFSIFGIIYLIASRASINSGECTLYQTKLVYRYGVIKKKVKEIPYDEIDDVYYQLGNLQQVFNIGTIVIKRKTRNLLERNVYIESIKDVETVFGKFEELFKK